MIKPKIKLAESSSTPCGLIIKDETGFGDTDGFPTVSSSGNYKLLDTVMITIITIYSQDKMNDVEVTRITRMYDELEATYAETVEEIETVLELDGWYNIHSFYVPNKKLYETNPEFFTQVYKFMYDEELDEVVDENGIVINLLDYVNILDFLNYTISRTSLPFFETCNGQNCYVQTNLAIAKQNCNIDSYSDLRKKRDQIWSILFGAAYKWGEGEYEEAHSLITILSKCNGLCNKINIKENCNCK